MQGKNGRLALVQIAEAAELLGQKEDELLAACQPSGENSEIPGIASHSLNSGVWVTLLDGKPVHPDVLDVEELTDPEDVLLRKVEQIMWIRPGLWWGA